MATAVAALIARARREIQHHFFAEDAIRPDRAVTFAPSNAIERRQFGRMLREGSMRQEGSDRYWIDVVAYDVVLRRRHNRVRAALLVVILALAASLAITSMAKLGA